MITASTSVFSCVANFLRGRKCIFWGSFKVAKTSRRYIKCRLCGKSKILSKLNREIELDEAYFGGRRKGKRGRGAGGKSIVFGLLERDGCVYTQVVDK
jgi:hypothetical protein